jgi:adenylate cyclase
VETREASKPASTSRSGEPLWRHFAMAGLIAALLVPLAFFKPFYLIEAKLFDILSVIAPPRPSQLGAEIVAIDEPSFSEIGQRWPWSRELHAKLIESLRAAGAKVIAFDIIFSEPSSEEADKRFAAVLGPDVVLASDDVTTRLDQGIQITRVNPRCGRGARRGIGRARWGRLFTPHAVSSG